MLLIQERGKRQAVLPSRVLTLSSLHGQGQKQTYMVTFGLVLPGLLAPSAVLRFLIFPELGKCSSLSTDYNFPHRSQRFPYNPLLSWDLRLPKMPCPHSDTSPQPTSKLNTCIKNMFKLRVGILQCLPQLLRLVHPEKEDLK